MTRFWMALALLVVHGVSAHPAHVTLIEADWRPQDRRLEMALKIAPEDLDLALSARSESEVADDRVWQLIEKHLRFRAGEATLPVVWVGWETSHRATWVYFQVDVPAGVTRIRLSNTLLMAEHPRQLNTLNLRTGQGVETFQFHRESPDATWRLPDSP